MTKGSRNLEWHVFLNEGSLRMVEELKRAGIDVEHILCELHDSCRESYIDEGYAIGMKESDKDLSEESEGSVISYEKGHEAGFYVGYDKGFSDGQNAGYESGKTAIEDYKYFGNKPL